MKSDRYQEYLKSKSAVGKERVIRDEERNIEMELKEKEDEIFL
jgi:hypothetical protein